MQLGEFATAILQASEDDTLFKKSWVWWQ